MYVCICNGITDKQIRRAAASGICDLQGLQRELGVATGCGTCVETAADILRDANQSSSTFDPVVYQPALA
jgi:bacterioferritin-associated ferredoxin